MTTEHIHIQTPARVCLFGDHQDYLGLPVIACAINRYLHLKASVNNEMSFKLTLPDLDEYRKIEISKIDEYEAKGDHLVSGLKVLKQYGFYFDRGYDVTISSEIPINAGVSSSSAVVVAWIHFLCEAFGSNIDYNAEDIGQWAYEAEVVLQNSPGGKMDQFTIALGGLLHIETGDKFDYHRINQNIKPMILGESGEPKETIGTLGDLRSKALKSIDMVKEHYPDFQLAKAHITELEEYLRCIPKDYRDYFEAAISNHQLTRSALLILRARLLNLKLLGGFMFMHHRILQRKLRITTPLINKMIIAANQAEAYGSKIVGSGGGGSIVVLAPEGSEEKVVMELLDAGAKDAYSIEISEGSKRIYD